jgi:hypothetical protein
MCDDALRHGGLSLAGCPRAELRESPVFDPFHKRSPAPTLH